MSRIRSRVAAAALTTLVSLASALTLTTSPAAAAGTSLPACNKITAHTTNDRLVNGNYSLIVTSDMLQIEEREWMNGPNGPDYWTTHTWFRDDPTGRYQSNTDKTYLALYCNGDLALRRANGYLLWHSNTANRGIVKATISQWGNLLLQNASGGVVWQSGTSRIGIPSGAILTSGSKLINRFGDQQGRPVQTLTMQADGNLVHRSGSTVKWQTNTRVPGSVAGLSPTARLFVRSPSGQLLWVSPCRAGTTYSTLWLGNEDLTTTDWSGGKITHIWSNLYGC
ncbi:hypothetical protein [Knoellia subterranea]|uniref:Bulb-type lectin domain-containing protein n=1 Tax=Knoellia subterranea KCTC 19937 TaxID=1385521 RepID=A0A0A0JQ31_9MICO|nr:hypothetical protein [Knoellia subterranea]KGN37711.1 hypothetical protein N803_11680 [Knoellia subterranea KCTC 19937]